IFRDQLDRFGELHSMARGLEASIEALPASATVVLNGDDPLVASLAPMAAARRMYFGIRADNPAARAPDHAADSIRCARCQHLLNYRGVHLSHLGDYRCPECGYTRPRLDVAVTAIRRAGSGRRPPGTPVGAGPGGQPPKAGSEIIAVTPAGTFPL